MYLEHFRLRELPFTITPDTEFFMNRAGYQDALNVLLVALRSGEGFVKVTGEVGVGNLAERALAPPAERPTSNIQRPTSKGSVDR